MFPDFNFKLVILEELLQTGSFAAELEALKGKEIYKEAYLGTSDAWGYNKPIEEIQEFLRKVELTADDLQQVEKLVFDGGNEIYRVVIPMWDGEDDFFDIHSVDGFQHLPNLQKVFYISMAEPNVLEPLRAAGIEIA